jgi:hypothetical protein
MPPIQNSWHKNYRRSSKNFLLEFPAREIVFKIWKFLKITVTLSSVETFSLSSCSRSGYQVSLMVVAPMILEPDGFELPILVLLGW